MRFSLVLVSVFSRIILLVIISYFVSIYLYFVFTYLHLHISVCLCFHCSMQSEVRSYFLVICDYGGQFGGVQSGY